MKHIRTSEEHSESFEYILFNFNSWKLWRKKNVTLLSYSVDWKISNFQ